MAIPLHAADTDHGTSLRVVAYERFKDALFTEQIRPGEFLSQREICDVIDVPLGPLREALKSLEAESIVTLLPKRGIRVVSVDEAMLAEAYEARVVIEGFAMRQFVSGATDAQIRHLTDTTKAFIKRFKAGKKNDAALMRERSDVDYLFHDTIVAHIANPFLEQAYKRSTDFVRLFRLNIGKKYSFFDTPGLEEHLDVLDALARRDVKRATVAFAKHLKGGRQRALGK